MSTEKAKKPTARKPLTPEQKAKKAAKAKEAREAKEKAAEEGKPEQIKGDWEALYDKTTKAIHEKIQAGEFNEAISMANDLEADEAAKAEVIALIEDMKAAAEAKEEEEKKAAKAKAKPKAPKVITAEDLIADWDKLYEKLTSYEAQQKAIKKPFRHVVLARNRMKQFRNNFKRNSGC